MLSDEEKVAFAELGFVRLATVFSPREAAAMRNRLWQAMAQRHGIEPDVPQTWTIEEPRQLGALGRSGAFEAVRSQQLGEAIDDLLGAGEWNWINHAGTLVTFPRAEGDWDVPYTRWHIDFPVRSMERLAALRVLAFIAPTATRGGGTLIVAGSHRVIAKLIARAPGEVLRSASVREEIAKDHPWFHDLMSRDAKRDRITRFVDEGATIDGVAVRVVELTGEAGDAFLVHPWLLHTTAPNHQPTPRMMVGELVFSTKQPLPFGS